MTRAGKAEGAVARWVMVPIVGLFFLWGMANNLNDVLIAHFRQALSLGDFASGLVQSAFYLGYFFCAVPAGLLMRRAGYQRAVVLGLGLYGVGALLFWPAAALVSYKMFLLGLFIIACGLAFLETAANPLVASLGAPEGAARRLILAQAFNPLGSIAGIEIGRRLILGGNAGLFAVVRPYMGIAALVLVWGVLIAQIRLPRVMPTQVDEGASADYRALLADRAFMAGVGAQFCYVGAQVGIWSYLIRFAQVSLPGTNAEAAAAYVTLALIAFTVGRFLGSALLVKLSAPRVLGACALVNIALCCLAAGLGGALGVWALVGASFFMSIMYPTIFALTISGLGERVRAGSSLLVMAIIGGAAVTALMGLVSDLASIRAAVLVPAACFVVVLSFARARQGRAKGASA